MAEALLYEFEEVHMQIQNPEALSEKNLSAFGLYTNTKDAQIAIDQFEKKVINDKFFLNEIIAAPESKRLEKLQEYFIYDSKEDSKDKESLCSKTFGKDLKKITLTKSY
jgi:hypothetical protein